MHLYSFVSFLPVLTWSSVKSIRDNIGQARPVIIPMFRLVRRNKTKYDLYALASDAFLFSFQKITYIILISASINLLIVLKMAII